MKPNLVSQGADRYVVGNIERFDQKNELWKRGAWDPIVRDAGRAYYAWYYGAEMPQEREGFTLKEMAMAHAGWHIAIDHGSAMFTGGSGLEVWEAQPFGKVNTTRIPKDFKHEFTDSNEASVAVKRAARLFGASLAGICELDRRWLYSNSYHVVTREHKPIEIGDEFKYAVVMAYEMDYEGIRQAPNKLAEATTTTAYSRMAFTGVTLAQYIRGLGYKALPMGNDTAISIPLAIDAGLGELSRMGLLVTPEYGPRVRLSKVITDMPLKPDSPIEFGVWDFCMKCEKCARFCPGQAIMHGPPSEKIHNISNREGLLRWAVDGEKCFTSFPRNSTACGVCIRVCPFNKLPGVLHDWVRWGVKNTRWLDSFFIKADDLLGYGKKAKISEFWAS